MKKVLVAVAVTALAGCSTNSAVPSSDDASTPPSSDDTSTPPSSDDTSTPPSLTGEWIVVDRDGSSPQLAGISEESIVVEWTLDDGLSGLYWAGTYEAPLRQGDFSWTSSAYAEITGSALLASDLDQKEFSYEDGFLVYEISYLGVTEILRLERVSSSVPDFVDSVEANLD